MEEKKKKIDITNIVMGVMLAMIVILGIVICIYCWI